MWKIWRTGWAKKSKSASLQWMKKKRLVLSARDILREKEREEKSKDFQCADWPGDRGTVETLQPYGAFIDLGNGLSGLSTRFSDFRETHQIPGFCPECGR